MNDNWNFPIPTSNSIMDIFHSIPLEIQPCPAYNDEVVWTPEDHGTFTLNSAYSMVCSMPNQDLQRPSLIWFKGCIKKDSMCAWMFLRGRLKRKDFLLQRNVDCDSCRMLCYCTWETSSHLMLHCPFS